MLRIDVYEVEGARVPGEGRFYVAEEAAEDGELEGVKEEGDGGFVGQGVGGGVGVVEEDGGERVGGGVMLPDVDVFAGDPGQIGVEFDAFDAEEGVERGDEERAAFTGADVEEDSARDGGGKGHALQPEVEQGGKDAGGDAVVGGELFGVGGGALGDDGGWPEAGGVGAVEGIEGVDDGFGLLRAGRSGHLVRLQDGEERWEECNRNSGDGLEAEEAIFDLGEELGGGGVVGGGCDKGDGGEEARDQAGGFGVGGESRVADEVEVDDVALQVVAVAESVEEVGIGHEGLVGGVAVELGAAVDVLAGLVQAVGAAEGVRVVGDEVEAAAFEVGTGVMEGGGDGGLGGVEGLEGRLELVGGGVAEGGGVVIGGPGGDDGGGGVGGGGGGQGDRRGRLPAGAVEAVEVEGAEGEDEGDEDVLVGL